MYLARFLSEVAGLSEDNKMDESNLAIVFTPAFFTVGDKAGGPEKLPLMTQVVQNLIGSQQEVVGFLFMT